MLELLGVLVVLGLTAGIVTMSWHRILPRERLNSDIRKLAQVLHGTREDAITRNGQFEMYYDLDENRYWVMAPYNAEGGRALTPEELGGEESDFTMLRIVELLDGVEFAELEIDGDSYDDGVRRVVFRPTGAATSHYVMLTQPNYGTFYTIEVLGLTGLIRVHDGEYRRERPKESEFD